MLNKGWLMKTYYWETDTPHANNNITM
ncbi:hypothetical protein S14_8 [Shewanella sp. phage 1/4]|nr:hypothetical protein S14_8 [Shewanella sp. phage 1/4]AHK11120.1 hypothetical protein S14_8 [Shewanella sp. phage 1/4]